MRAPRSAVPGGAMPQRRQARGGTDWRLPDGSPAAPDPSIGPMTDSSAAFLLRNVVDALPEGALERKLGEGRPLRVKLGIDPTPPDIHLGHVVVLQKLREFQDAGHDVVLIVGDYTARVGDPSGRSSERPVLSPEEIDRNAETFRRQAFTVLDPERTELRMNGEWLDLRAEGLFPLGGGGPGAPVLGRGRLPP